MRPAFFFCDPIVSASEHRSLKRKGRDAFAIPAPHEPLPKACLRSSSRPDYSAATCAPSPAASPPVRAGVFGVIGAALAAYSFDAFASFQALRTPAS